MDRMKLGILYKDSKVVNHRSFLKVIFNPILRKFGICIATIFDDKTWEAGGIKIIKCEKKKIKWDFNDHNNFDAIAKKRRLI